MFKEFLEELNISCKDKGLLGKSTVDAHNGNRGGEIGKHIALKCDGEAFTSTSPLPA